ncbi:hypothetical protein [Rubrivirga sp.]|uniref:hypothetical protein n=1 Tax=Rubrivirga sp. TaxID=1885344 RepID=UPI003B520BCB
MPRLVFGLAVVLSLAACDTDGAGLLDPQEVNVSALSQDPARLVGAWELATVTPSGECIGEDCTRTRSAAAVGRSERLVFEADGMAEVICDGAPARRVAYRVEPVEYGDGTQSEIPYLFVDSRAELFGVTGDQLFLDNRPVDGELREYRRR